MGLPRPKQPELRVLVAGHLPPPMGGIATYYKTLMASSLADRVNLRFVQTSSQTRNFSTAGQASLANITSAAKDCLRFAKAVFAHRPRVSHIATAFGLSFIKHSLCVITARLAGSRVILHPHCSFDTLYTQRPGWWKWYFRQIIRMTDGVIALSKEWQQLTAVVPGCRVYNLVNAVDLAQYEPAAAAHRTHPQQNGTLKVLYLGYIGQAKGIFDLIAAAKIVVAANPNVSFELVGNESLPGEKAQASQVIADARLEPSVHLRPAVYDTDKLDLFCQADVFVYPSYHEGMPMAVLEAMASGLPVVATRVGGLPDMVVDQRSGVLVPPGQPEQLAAALDAVLRDPAGRAAMGQESARLAQECYGIEQHVDKLIDIYQAVSR